MGIFCLEASVPLTHNKPSASYQPSDRQNTLPFPARPRESLSVFPASRKDKSRIAWHCVAAAKPRKADRKAGGQPSQPTLWAARLGQMCHGRLTGRTIGNPCISPSHLRPTSTRRVGMHAARMVDPTHSCVPPPARITFPLRRMIPHLALHISEL